MTTNETSWFRNETPFEVFADEILKDLHYRGLKHPRIWSAACSFGQEPYSLSILVAEFEKKHSCTMDGLRIVASDISSTVLNQARRGYYDEHVRMRGVSRQRQRLFFENTDNGWRVREHIRHRIQFREFNLLEDFAALGHFDVIFCRNVLIYFSPAVKASILYKISMTLNPGGYLFLGGTESIASSAAYFEAIRFGRNLVYRRL